MCILYPLLLNTSLGFVLAVEKNMSPEKRTYEDDRPLKYEDEIFHHFNHSPT